MSNQKVAKNVSTEIASRCVSRCSLDNSIVTLTGGDTTLNTAMKPRFQDHYPDTDTVADANANAPVRA